MKICNQCLHIYNAKFLLLVIDTANRKKYFAEFENKNESFVCF